MPQYANATIVGHLGKDPEVNTVRDTKVANFSIAVTRKRGQKETTTWYNIAAWGRLADVAMNFLKKGGAVLVQGDIWQETYTKKDGSEGTKLSVEAKDIALLGKSTAGETEFNGESLEPVAKAMQAAQAQAVVGTKPEAGAARDPNEPPF